MYELIKGRSLQDLSKICCVDENRSCLTALYLFVTEAYPGDKSPGYNIFCPQVDYE